MARAMDSIDILDRLIAFPTVSRDSNLQLVGWVRKRLAERGVDCSLVHDATGAKANLYATIRRGTGSRHRPGPARGSRGRGGRGGSTAAAPPI